jgi:hypothetical protein
LLAVEEHAGVEVGDNVVKGERWVGVKGRNDAEGGDNLEVLVALEDKGEVGSLCADSEV